jgi:hypothetical protein
MQQNCDTTDQSKDAYFYTRYLNYYVIFIAATFLGSDICITRTNFRNDKNSEE